MKNKVRWGVLGAAKIAINKVIPAMRQSAWSEIRAIASRRPDQIRQTALDLGISKIYASYDDLLNDPEVEAIYNPLPIIYTFRGQSKPRPPVNTFYAKNRSG